MEKRTLLAIVISIAIMVIWSFLFQNLNKDKKENISSQKVETALPVTEQALKVLNENHIQRFGLIEKTDNIDSLNEKEISDSYLENELLKIVFTNRGAIIKQVILKKYKDQDNNDIKLLDLQKSDEFFPMGIFFENTALNNNLNLGIWDIEKKESGDKSVLTFIYNISNIQNTQEQALQKIKVIKEFSLQKNNYLLNISVKFINPNTSIVIIPEHKLIWEPLLKNTETGKSEDNFILYLNGKVKHTIISKIEKSEIFPIALQKNIVENNWISVSNKYFVATMIPGSETKSLCLDKKDEGKNSLYTIGLLMKEIKINSEGNNEEKNDIYIGPREYDKLNVIGKNLEDNIDFGFFGIMSKWLLIILKILNNWMHNYGLAIIVITIVIKIIFMPLTEKSYISMRATSSIQPEIDALKQKYKNDPQRFNAEVMKLYKEKKVNPFAGCLPMLAQIPIFWALFNTLKNAIELRHAPFILWINDLSHPDTVISISSLPINILPIFMLISMVVQQKMTTHKNPNSTKEEQTQQKILLYGMPVIFGVMFYNMPSGLVLYWFLNNILSIIHQYFINKKLALQK